MVCFEWLLRCAELKRRTRVAPYQHLHLPDATRRAMSDIDRFGDPCVPIDELCVAVERSDTVRNSKSQAMPIEARRQGYDVSETIYLHVAGSTMRSARATWRSS